MELDANRRRERQASKNLLEMMSRNKLIALTLPFGRGINVPTPVTTIVPARNRKSPAPHCEPGPRRIRRAPGNYVKVRGSWSKGQ